MSSKYTYIQSFRKNQYNFQILIMYVDYIFAFPHNNQIPSEMIYKPILPCKITRQQNTNVACSLNGNAALVLVELPEVAKIFCSRVKRECICIGIHGQNVYQPTALTCTVEMVQFGLGCSTFYSYPPFLIFIVNSLLLAKRKIDKVTREKSEGCMGSTVQILASLKMHYALCQLYF